MGRFQNRKEASLAVKISKLSWSLVSGLALCLITPFVFAFTACAGTVVTREPMACEEALHWGVAPRSVLARREYEIQVKRFIGGEAVRLCVSYRCYHSLKPGDYYLGQY